MGWHLEHMSSYSFQGWHDASGERTGWTERNFIGVWAPSTDIAAAWEVVEKMKESEDIEVYRIHDPRPQDTKWACRISNMVAARWLREAAAEPLPR